GVEVGTLLPARDADGSVTRRGVAMVPLAQHPQAPGGAPDDRRRVVDRAVVDDDHLGCRVGLGERAVERVGEEPRPVAARDDDAHESIGHVRWLDSGSAPLPQRRNLDNARAAIYRGAWRKML